MGVQGREEWRGPALNAGSPPHRAGPTVLEMFNTLLRQLRLSIDYALTGSYDGAGVSLGTKIIKEHEERMFQEAVIKTIGAGPSEGRGPEMAPPGTSVRGIAGLSSVRAAHQHWREDVESVHGACGSQTVPVGLSGRPDLRPQAKEANSSRAQSPRPACCSQV